MIHKTNKKRMRIIISVILAVLTIFSSVSVAASALTINAVYDITQTATKYKYIKYWGDTGSVATPNNRGWETFYKRAITVTGEPAYCLEFGKDFTDGTDTTATEITETAAWINASASARVGVLLASMYGYPNNYSEYGDAAYYATQIIIWEYMLNYRTSASASDPYAGITGGYDENNVACRFILSMQAKGYTDIYTAYCGILAEIAQHDKTPALNGTSLNLKLTYNISTGKYVGTFVDTNGILSKYSITESSQGLDITKNGNVITISSDNPISPVPASSIAKLKMTKNFTNCESGVALYSGVDSQTLIYGTLPDPRIIVFNVYTGVGTLTIQKNSEDNNIEGVKFNVRCDALGYNQDFTTDSEGLITIPNLVSDYDYIVTEETMPKYLAIEPYTVHLTESGVRAIFNNHLKKGSVTVNKSDVSDGKALAGAEFVICKGDTWDWGNLVWNDEMNNDYFVTNVNGQFTANNLAAGNYILREGQAPTGYVTDETLYYFTIVDDTTNLVYNITNEREQGSLRIIKKDDSGKTISNAQFKIVAAEDISDAIKTGDIVAENVTTLGDGTVEVLLQTGKYNIFETSAPSGLYFNPDKAYPVEIVNTSETFEVEIVNTTYDVEINKVSDTGSKLLGAKIEVYPADTSYNISSDTPIFTGITNGTDNLKLENLTIGYFVIKEVETTDGYAVPKDNLLANLSIQPSADKNAYTVVFSDIADGSSVTGNTLNAVNYPIAVTIHKVEVNTNNALKDAKFVIYSTLDSNDKRSVVTDENGNATFKGLMANTTYVYKEETSPLGYYSDNNFYTFTTDEYGNISPSVALNAITGYPEIVVENTPTVFTIIKEDDLGNRLEGAVFDVFDKETNKVKSDVRTNNNGEIILTGLPEGDYYLVETKAPDGYELTHMTRAELSFTVGTDYAKSLTVYDDATEITLHKINSAANIEDIIALENAEYQLYVFDETDYVRANDITYRTNSEGNITIRNLLVNTKYYLVETKAPDGYYTDPTRFYFEINEYGVATGDSITNNVITAVDERTSYTITKKDFVTNELIENAQFTIYGSDANGNIDLTNVVKVGFTNSSGKLLIDGLPEGTYYAIETKTPIGYMPNPTPIKFVIGFNDEKAMEVYNTQTSATLKKVDSSDLEKALQNVEFDLYKRNGLTYEKVNENALKTSEKGEISVSKLEVDTEYYFVETTTPDGYYTDQTRYEFKINEEGNFVDMQGKQIDEIVVKNTPTLFYISKTDADTGEAIEGVVFAIYASDGTYKGSYTTDGEGIITLSMLTEGSYYAVETVFPTGYIQDSTQHNFSINSSTMASTLSVTNSKTSVTLSKVDLVNGEPVEGATIEIYNGEGTCVYSGVSDNKGTITVDYLPVGSYTFKETINPDGYQINSETYDFTINADGTITNGYAITNAPTEIVITKTDEDGKLLQGATIGIYDATGNLVYSGITNELGQIKVSYLKSGDYTYKELAAPNGYKLNKNTYSFRINRDGSVEGENIMINESTSVTITKTDKNDVPLKGATIAVYDEDGKEVYVGITNEFGKISISGLYAGAYTYKEIECPDGYVLDEKTYEFTIDSEGNVEGDNTIVNEETSIVITKTDNEGNAIEGATIGIYTEEGELLFTLVTDDLGKAYAYNLLTGKYYFMEILPANGYEINLERYEFEITREGVTEGADTLVNSLTEVVIKKTDKQNNPLANAEIGIYDTNDTLICSGLTDENGEYIVRGLKSGNYYAKEINAPDGYLLSTEKVEFTVNDYGIAQGSFVITNERVPVEVNVPKTGSDTPLKTLSVTAMLGVAIACFNATRIKKNRKNDENED